MLNIKWRGKKYLFVGDKLSDGGAIATRTQYRRGEMSTAHLFPHGHISIFGKPAGTRDDITVVGECEPPKNNTGALSNIIEETFRVLMR